MPAILLEPQTTIPIVADISQMESSAFINAPYRDGTTVWLLADIVNRHNVTF